MSAERREQTSAVTATVREISCSRCGAVIKPGKKFCSRCGSPALAAPSPSPSKRLRGPNICPECSFENHHSDLFCKGCGAQLADSPIGLPSSDSARQTPSAPPAGDVVKTDLTVPPVTSQEPADLGTDAPVRQAMEAASAPPAEEPEEVVETDAAGSLARCDQPPDLGRPDLGREIAAPLPVTSGAPSQDAGDESPAVQPPADSEVAKPRRPNSRAVGVAVGVCLAVLVPLVHFHRPAKARPKQFSITTPAFVGTSPTRAGSVARTDSANQHLGSANLSSAVGHGQSRGYPFQPSRALSRKSLEDALPANSKGADVHQMTATGSAPALTTAYDHQPAVPAPFRPAPTSNHSQVQNSAPPADGSPQAPALLAEVSRQIPGALPAEINPGPASTEGPVASANASDAARTVQPASLLSRPALRDPALALEAHVEGDVHLQARVGGDGAVSSVRVVRGNLRRCCGFGSEFTLPAGDGG
jgi:hypothetical protein